MHHPEELLHAELNLLIHLAGHLVAHEDARHRLQSTDLQGEIEGSDHTASAERHANTCRRLPCVVAGHSEGLSEVPHLVTGVVLKKLPGYLRLSVRLGPGLRRQPLDQPGKEVLHLWLPHLCRPLGTCSTQHVVTLGVLQGIVEPSARAAAHAIHEGADLLERGVGHSGHNLAIQGIDHVQGLRSIPPLPAHQILAHSWGGSTHSIRINCRPFWQ
mmetsp:Transcript_30039/g.86174  ORF Transcript_30039/g.86174 Transcript_30039/m.86174 type:complete len:215 (+) Transcript_30039:1003-1647(+)